MAYDLLLYICPPNGKQYRLFGLGDENCQCFQADDGWIEFRKNRHMEEFYVTDKVIGRGADTSEISRDGVNPTEKFYVQYTRKADGSLSYGADWAKRIMDIGERFNRNCHVIRYRADGSILEESDELSDLVVNAHHTTLPFPQSGITIEDVLELQWGGEEVYFYAKDFGLVGWKNLRTGQGSFIGVLSATIEAPFPHPVNRPPVAMPPSVALEPDSGATIYPDGTRPQQMHVNHRDGLWLLGQPADSSTRNRVLSFQEIVTVFQEPIVTAGQFDWQRILTKRGEQGWSAISVEGQASFSAVGGAAPDVSIREAAVRLTPIFFRVKGARVKIRREAGLDGILIDQILDPGDIIEVDPASSTVKDGYVWWKHALGWSAERTADDVANPEILLEQVDRTRSIPVSRGREIEPSVLFEIEPVSLNKTIWLQYFGNTKFAFNLSLDRDPKRQKIYYYAQGLHAGIDYGNDDLPDVVAGVNGTVQAVFRDSPEYAPNYLVIKIDSVTIIYGHVHNIPQEIVKGSLVQPMTKIAEIAPSGVQGSPHLHLELRYSNTKIVNPLLFMPEGMWMALTQKFSDYDRHFYRDATWKQWLTPLDQPVLQLSRKESVVLVGPLASRG